MKCVIYNLLMINRGNHLLHFADANIFDQSIFDELKVRCIVYEVGQLWDELIKIAYFDVPRPNSSPGIFYYTSHMLAKFDSRHIIYAYLYKKFPFIRDIYVTQKEYWCFSIVEIFNSLGKGGFSLGCQSDDVIYTLASLMYINFLPIYIRDMNNCLLDEIYLDVRKHFVTKGNMAFIRILDAFESASLLIRN